MELSIEKSIADNGYKANYKNKTDGLKLLEAIPDKTVKTAFFDPQYRGVLDKLSYGNEGERWRQFRHKESKWRKSSTRGVQGLFGNKDTVCDQFLCLRF